MRLLVSVATPEEASAALAGGADVIDAKDPRFALGAVSVDMLRRIHAACASLRPLTAALGDASDEGAIERDARMTTEAGALLVKVGFAGIADRPRIATLLVAAVRGARASRSGGAVAVAYADANRVASLGPAAFVDVAARAGAAGVLLDTADKSGPGLRTLMSAAALAAWVARGHEAGLFVALAGKLVEDDLPYLRDTGADIAGVRGAACDGQRTGHVSAEKVRRLVQTIRRYPDEDVPAAVMERGLSLLSASRRSST
jgi:(5-formylfuran-3-yl)methyl phosphate synthase